MERDEVIRITYQKLLQQGGPSACLNPTSMGGVECLYNGENGRHCAAGWWIPPALYHPQLEGKGATSPEVRRVLPAELVALVTERHHRPVLSVMQAAHDRAARRVCQDADLSWAKALHEEFADDFPGVKLD